MTLTIYLSHHDQGSNTITCSDEQQIAESTCAMVVQEISTCEYVMTVLTAGLCGLPGFRVITPPVDAVLCRLIPSATQTSVYQVTSAACASGGSGCEWFSSSVLQVCCTSVLTLGLSVSSGVLQGVLHIGPHI